MRMFLLLLLFSPLSALSADSKAAEAAANPAPPAATTPAPAPKPKQWVYVLRLVSRLHDDNGWTEADKKTVGSHFAHLKAATAEGKVVLAGRTLDGGAKTFGLVIFEAPDEAAARKFMQSDPAVIANVMTAELHPYQVALQRK